MSRRDKCLTKADIEDCFNKIPHNYKVLQILGFGSFGIIVKCYSQKDDREVALKVTRYNYSLKREALMCRALKRHWSHNTNIVEYCGEVYRNGDLSLAFEVLDITMLEYYIKYGRMRLDGIRTVIQQLAEAFAYLKRFGIIHSDLKPDNIMLVDHINQPFKVKLTDFGLAVYSRLAMRGRCHQALYYRAPEIILQLPFSEAIDIWSLGCVMVFMLRESLFAASNEHGVLTLACKLLGPPPQHLRSASGDPGGFFKKDGDLRVLKTTEEFSGGTVEDTTFLTSRSLDEMKMHRLEEDNPMEADDRRECIELMKAMLQWDANERITPEGILNHPFITRSYATNSTLPSDDTSHEELPRGVIQVQPAAPDNRFSTIGQIEATGRDSTAEPEGHLIEAPERDSTAEPEGHPVEAPERDARAEPEGHPIEAPERDFTAEPGGHPVEGPVRITTDLAELPEGVVVLPTAPENRHSVGSSTKDTVGDSTDHPVGDPIDAGREESPDSFKPPTSFEGPKASCTSENSVEYPCIFIPTRDQMDPKDRTTKKKKKNCFKRLWSWITKKVDSIWF